MGTPIPTHHITRSRVPSGAGLILLDCSQRPLYYSSEAIRLLSYPENLNSPERAIDFLPKEIRSRLACLPTRSDLPYVTEFMSGRRRCMCRAFALVQNSGRPSRVITALLIERSAPRSPKISEVAAHFRLSQREQEAVELLTLGLTSKEIAGQMHVAPSTVKTFFRLIMSKMAVNTRSGIVGMITRM